MCVKNKVLSCSTFLYPGGGGQPPCLRFLKYCKNIISAQNMLIILCCIAGIFNRGVDASQANLLKKGPALY